MIKPIGSNSNLIATQQKAEAELEQNNFDQVLKKAGQAQDDKKLKEACQELESVFLYQMLSAMRSTLSPNPLLGRSQAEEIFQGMLDQEVTKNASKTGTVGLADILYNQLKQTMTQQKNPGPAQTQTTDTTTDK
ncbi:MAG: rod-binding protein [Methylocystaceae bacterium]